VLVGYSKFFGANQFAKVRTSKQRRKCVKLMSKKIHLLIGEDLMLEQIIPMQEMALVGKFWGRYMKEKTLQEWLAKIWVNVLG
jgi:hypothetical protein